MRALAGDLRCPRLGMDAATWNRLTDTITDVVHCAADIRFNLSLEEARRVNTDGTRTVLQLARESKGLRRLAHISTTYIMGRDTGELPETQYRNRTGFINTYERAKYEAECAVFASMVDIPVSVFRLSSVAGKQANYIHQALRLLPRNPFPFIPGVPDCRFDLISANGATNALSCLFESHFCPGSVHHVCAGPNASIPVSLLMELAYAALGIVGTPAMVPLCEFERWSQWFLLQSDRASSKAILRSVSSFLPHLAIHQTFQNAATMALLQDHPPPSVEVLRTVFAQLSEQSGTSEPAGKVTLPPSKESAA